MLKSILVIKISDEIMEIAKKWSDFKGNEFSIRRDESKMIAANIAEVVFGRTYMDAVRISHEDYNADFVMRGKRIDVKCKERKVYCKADYDVSIEARQKDYDVDWYVFYSYNVLETVLEYLGWKSKADYFNKAVLYKKGDCIDNNKWIVSVDCYNLKIKELWTQKKEDEVWKKRFLS